MNGPKRAKIIAALSEGVKRSFRDKPERRKQASRHCQQMAIRFLKLKQPSNLELEVENFLLLHGIDYKTQFVVRAKQECTVADFWIRDSDLLVYVDGTYWHSRPATAAKDLRIRSWLPDRARKFFVVRESCLYEDLASLLQEIL